jgi:hypothetical protein
MQASLLALVVVAYLVVVGSLDRLELPAHQIARPYVGATYDQYTPR